MYNHAGLPCHSLALGLSFLIRGQLVRQTFMAAIFTGKNGMASIKPKF